MSELARFRSIAGEILDAVLRSINPRTAIRSTVEFSDSRLLVHGRQIELAPATDVFGIAIGKAATAMAEAVEDVFGDEFVAGVISAPRRGVYRWDYFEGGHPLPNEASLDAAKAAFNLLDLVKDFRALIVFLISGGGSAMMEWPISDDISLDDLRTANQLLINSGASITEINSVRRAFSAVKGGQLAARAPNCAQLTLIVSDVPKGKEYNVASGPTIAPPSDATSATEVIARYALTDRLPPSLMRAVQRFQTPEPPPLKNHIEAVILDNDTALEAAACAARDDGFVVEIARDISDEPIEEGCDKLLTRLIELRQSAATNVCLISGGEFSCPVRGDGMGGRNSETALRLAIAAAQQRDRLGHFVAVCAGTDGIDGNCPNGGAIADSSTLERATEIGIDADDFLRRSDSGTFFAVLGDELTTGLTGTNVRDLRVLIA